MSYDIELCDPETGHVLKTGFRHHLKGGTFAVGGSSYCDLNITYNYSVHYYKLFGEEGIRAMYGKSGAESISILQDAIAKLKDDVSDDYWEATEGNAKQALQHLLTFAKIRPDGVWKGN